MTQFSNKTAVVVEDEPFIAADIEALLQDFGIEVLQICPTVEAAMKAVETVNADIFTLDYELGSQTSDPIAETLIKKHKKFIVISGKIEMLERRASFTETPLLSKPIDPKALAIAIEEALS